MQVMLKGLPATAVTDEIIQAAPGGQKRLAGQIKLAGPQSAQKQGWQI